MAEDTLPLAGMVDPKGGADPGSGDGVGDASRRGRAGRKSTQEEVQRHLARHGLVAVPAGEPGEDDGRTLEAGLDEAAAFDEEATRGTVGLLVEFYGEVKVDAIRSAALEATRSRTDAEDYADRARLSQAKRDAIVNAATESARRHSLTLSPELALVAIALGELREFRALRRDLQRIGIARDAAAPSPAA